jgi:hypothetical protein
VDEHGETPGTETDSHRGADRLRGTDQGAELVAGMRRARGVGEGEGWPVRGVRVLFWLAGGVACHSFPAEYHGMIADEVAAFRVALGKARRVLAALQAAGFEVEEFPQFTAGLDGQGRPVVVIGPVSPETAARLARMSTRREGSGGQVA